jgi:hypothetical protein
VADAVSEILALPSSGTTTLPAISIAVTNFAGACGTGTPQGSDGVLSIFIIGSQPGGYTVGTPNADVSYMTQWGATCNAYTWATQGGSGTTSTKAGFFEDASGGTVTLTSVTSTMVEGSFDATFASGDHLTGTFTAPVCTVQAPGSGC